VLAEATPVIQVKPAVKLAAVVEAAILPEAVKAHPKTP